jgi:ribosomal-protein-alanine N-acetyltransferase
MEDDRTLKINIRRMALEDVEIVHQIDVMSFSLPWPERSFRYELTQNPASRMWVIETETKNGSKIVIGMLGMWLIVDEIHIGTITTHPDYRRRGIAKSLLIEALRAAYQEGARMVYLEVRRSNLAAQELYKKFGFEIAGLCPRYYSNNHEDALMMNLKPLDLDAIERMANVK